VITTQSTDARVVNELGLIDGCFDETGLSRSCEYYWSARSASCYRDGLITTECDRSCCSFVWTEREREGCPPDLDLPFVDNHPPPPELRLEGGRVYPLRSIASPPFPP
jgi:hypothetical protein